MKNQIRLDWTIKKTRSFKGTRTENPAVTNRPTKHSQWFEKKFISQVTDHIKYYQKITYW